MRNKLIISSLVILAVCTISNAQQTDSSTFEGFFRGHNLNIQCRDKPITPWVECNCIDSIAVNGKVIDDILYKGLQVDIANKANVEIFDTLKVTFYHSEICDFRLLNPNHFLPEVIEPVDTVYIDTNYVIHWTTAQNYPGLRLWVQIEQYKWDEWVKIDQNYLIKTEKNYQADISKYIHQGDNQFRVVVASIDHDRIPSDTVKVKSDKLKVHFKINSGNIIFDQPTHYELYDSNSLITDRGFGYKIRINTFDVPDGKYLLRYGNQTTSVFIRDNRAIKK